MRWVHNCAPEFERRWNRLSRPIGSSWRVDETYVKIRGKWVYLDRAVDREGRTVDFRRDVGAAKGFFRKAIQCHGLLPRTITLDGYAASHRGVKLRIGPMLGLKLFRTTAITIAGIELLSRIQKGQFNIGRLRLDRSASDIWNVVLAAS